MRNHGVVFLRGPIVCLSFWFPDDDPSRWIVGPQAIDQAIEDRAGLFARVSLSAKAVRWLRIYDRSPNSFIPSLAVTYPLIIPSQVRAAVLFWVDGYLAAKQESSRGASH